MHDMTLPTRLSLALEPLPWSVEVCTLAEANALLTGRHYLGPSRSARICYGVFAHDTLVACQVWRWPTARMLPSDGTWLELSRWCLTSEAGANAGSRMMSAVAKDLRSRYPNVETLVSYSDPVHGHTGSLYRASNWRYAPTHIGLRFDKDGIGFPSGNGSWNGVDRQNPKHRWLYDMKRGRRNA